VKVADDAMGGKVQASERDANLEDAVASVNDGVVLPGKTRP
jgi:hypothetical protein